MRICAAAVVAMGLCGLIAGCRSPTAYREGADRTAYDIVRAGQKAALGRTEPFTVEPPSATLRRQLLKEQDLPQADPSSLGSGDVERIPQWPDATYGSNRPAASVTIPVGTNGVLRPTLLDALQIAARNARDYQDQKERVFQAALALDLERNKFRGLWTGRIDSKLATDGSGDERVSDSESGVGVGLKRNLATGGAFAFDLGIDLVKLLTQDKASAFGVLADATLSVPLLRGAGRFVVTEPLTQAERDVVYAIYDFERFKLNFAVRVATDYLGVLQQLDQVANARENYKRLIRSTRRAERLADAGELPQIQVDQARQDELRARNRWISAQLSYEGSLDAFKVLLGLPADAALELDRREMADLVRRADALIATSREQALPGGKETPAANDPVVLREPSREGGGALEIDPGEAIRLAFQNRLDLRTRIGRLFDAQRSVAVAADQLRADLVLLGRGSAGESRSAGSAGDGNAKVDVSKGRYSTSLGLDLPLERTAERNRYRTSLIEFEQAVRAVQAMEDQVKLDVRDMLRNLLDSRETVLIQATAVAVAQRRLDSTSMFLEAGRAVIRDVLEAEESLVSAQNALSAALVRYRVGELQIQRDMGVLEINEQGVWREYIPVKTERKP